MKLSAVFVAITTLAAAGFSAQGIAAAHDSHSAMHAPAAAAATEIPLAEGVVKKVDQPAGTVTIAHGPLVNLGMPAMTMAFRVKETTWLAKMKAGRKIRFAADQVDGALTMVRFEPAK